MLWMNCKRTFSSIALVDVDKLGGRRRGRREALVFASEGGREELDWTGMSPKAHILAPVCW
jgi:hypothetical protein